MILTREASSLSFQFNSMVYPRGRFENTIELKEAILQEWELGSIAPSSTVINNNIDGFRSRVPLVIAENGQHIEKY